MEKKQQHHNVRMTPYSIQYNKEWLCTYRPDDIYTELQGDHVGEYWINKKHSPGITEDTFWDIDWDEYHRSVKPLSFGIKLFKKKN